MAEIFELVDKQISSFDRAVRNVDFMAYLRDNKNYARLYNESTLSTIQVAVTN